MSYFALPSLLFTIIECKLQKINYLGYGKESWFFCYRSLVFLLFLSEGVPLSLGVWERLCYFIVALPEPSV